MITQILEATMILCFGISWPMQIIKTIRVKNPAGKSFTFLTLILIGYIAGTAGKLISHVYGPLLWLYILNTLMVGTDLVLSLFYLHRIRKQQKDASK